MPTYPLPLAQANLSDLLAKAEAEAGEEVILARGEEEAVRSVPVPRQATGPRRPGRLEGLITVGPEFLDPLPDGDPET